VALSPTPLWEICHVRVVLPRQDPTPLRFGQGGNDRKFPFSTPKRTSHHHTVTLLSNSVLLIMTTVSAPSPMV
jgi:hypothetical protein